MVAKNGPHEMVELESRVMMPEAYASYVEACGFDVAAYDAWCRQHQAEAERRLLESPNE